MIPSDKYPHHHQYILRKNTEAKEEDKGKEEKNEQDLQAGKEGILAKEVNDETERKEQDLQAGKEDILAKTEVGKEEDGRTEKQVDNISKDYGGEDGRTEKQVDKHPRNPEKQVDNISRNPGDKHKRRMDNFEAINAEKNRKMILAQADEIDILKRNVRDLQGQLNSAQIHNKNLTQSLSNAYDDISTLTEEANANQ